MAVVTEINTLAESDPHTGTLEAVAQDIALKLLALDERFPKISIVFEKIYLMKQFEFKLIS